MTERKKVTIDTLQKNKVDGKKTVWLTSYDYPSAILCEQNNIDLVLCGDSLANTMLGYDKTTKVGMQEMLHHTAAVARGLKNTMLVADMPFGSYFDNKTCLKNAAKFIRLGAAACKLEGFVPAQVTAMRNAGILPVVHLGLVPQSQDSFGGYKVQAKTSDGIKNLVYQATTLEDAGAAFILLEAVPQEATDAVLDAVKMPVAGIGAGHCDIQLLIWHDVMGYFFGDFKPKFAKAYCDLKGVISKALDEYKEDVLAERFPFAENIYAGPTKSSQSINECISHNWDKAKRKCFNCGVLEKDLYINRRESPGC